MKITTCTNIMPTKWKVSTRHTYVLPYQLNRSYKVILSLSRQHVCDWFSLLLFLCDMYTCRICQRWDRRITSTVQWETCKSRKPRAFTREGEDGYGRELRQSPESVSAERGDHSSRYTYHIVFMPPAWKVRRGHLVFGSSVRPSVCPFVRP